MTSRKRLLVVEDNPATREMFVVVLEREGFEVITAEDGRVGILKAIQLNPDLIITGLNLPHLSGVDMIRKLRDTTFRDGPILAVTAYGDLAPQARKAGANYVISKPVPLRILLGHIAEFLGEPGEKVVRAAN